MAGRGEVPQAKATALDMRLRMSGAAGALSYRSEATAHLDVIFDVAALAIDTVDRLEGVLHDVLAAVGNKQGGAESLADIEWIVKGAL